MTQKATYMTCNLRNENKRTIKYFIINIKGGD